MIAVVQRVARSWVRIEGTEVARIDRGLNILLGVLEGDGPEDCALLAKKILSLRIFPDERGKMGKSVLDVGGEIVVVSQFTLAAQIKRGNRPDFTQAMEPGRAKELYEHFCALLAEHAPVQTGVFGAMMEVGIVNDGPVTIIADSKRL